MDERILSVFVCMEGACDPYEMTDRLNSNQSQMIIKNELDLFLISVHAGWLCGVRLHDYMHAFRLCRCAVCRAQHNNN